MEVCECFADDLDYLDSLFDDQSLSCCSFSAMMLICCLMVFYIGERCLLFFCVLFSLLRFDSPLTFCNSRFFPSNFAQITKSQCTMPVNSSFVSC